MGKTCSLQKFWSLVIAIAMVMSIFSGLTLTAFADDSEADQSGLEVISKENELISNDSEASTGNTDTTEDSQAEDTDDIEVAANTTAIMLTSASPGVTQTGRLQVQNGTLCDAYGTHVQLKGMSTFGLQWGDGDWILTDEAFDVLATDWQSDIVRLAMYVGENGYASNPSGILAKLEQGIALATAQDMYVMVDWHVLSPGDPNSPVYLEAGLNDPDMPAEFLALKSANPTWTGPQVFFAYIAQKYGAQGNILYEPANEPNGLGSEKDRFSTWSEKLKPYYESIIDVIRQYDSDGIIICGTDNWSQFVDGPIFDPIEDENVMYTMHFYAGTHDAGYDSSQSYVKAGESKAGIPAGAYGQYWLRKMVDTALKNDLPVFCTEWGSSTASGDGGPYIDFAQRWIEYMNDKNISWCAWSAGRKDEISAAFKSGASATPNGAWDDNELSVAGRFYRSMIRGEEVPVYKGYTQLTDFEESSPRLTINSDSANKTLEFSYETLDGQTVAKISNVSANGVWDNRPELSGIKFEYGMYQNLEFDVYLPSNKVDTSTDSVAFSVQPVFSPPPSYWNSSISETTVLQNEFEAVSGDLNWVKAHVVISLQPLTPVPGDITEHLMPMISLSADTQGSDVCIGNMAFSYEHNGDIVYNPTPDRPGDFVSIPFTFESDTREGWAKDGASKIENTDLSIGMAETHALMFPFTFEPGARRWEDGVRLSSPFWPDSALTLDDCRNIAAVSLEVFLEDGKATTGELEMALLPIPAGAGYWHEDVDRVQINPVNGGTVITNSEDKTLRKYMIVAPFAISDYSEEVRVRNLILALYNADDSDYSGNVYYDNIGFMTADEYADYLKGPVTPVTPDGDNNNSSSSSSSGGGGGGSSTVTNAPAPMNQTAAVAATTKAVAEAVKAGSTSASVTLKNVSEVTLNNLKAITQAAKGTTIKLSADSMIGSKVDVRISINPALATKNINLSASTTSQTAKSAKTKFEKFYDNKISVVSLSQKGDFGMTVEIAAKVGSDLDVKALVFYSYDKSTNSFKRITGTEYWIDRNGYLHFTTMLAGEIIITDRPLTKK